ARLGFRTVDEMIGRSNVLRATETQNGLDLSKILTQLELPDNYHQKQVIDQNFELESTLDKTTLNKICLPAIEKAQSVSSELLIKNTDRSVGTIIGSHISKKYGAKGLPQDTIQLKF